MAAPGGGAHFGETRRHPLPLSLGVLNAMAIFPFEPLQQLQLQRASINSSSPADDAALYLCICGLSLRV